MGPTNTDARNSTTWDLRGPASGAFQAVRQVGGTVGLAILGTIVASVEHRRIVDAIVGLGGTEAQADQVSGVLAQRAGEQSQVAAAIPAADQAEVLASARDAVADGIAASCSAGGGVLLVTAIAAFALLRHARAADEVAGDVAALEAAATADPGADVTKVGRDGGDGPR